MIRIIPCLDCDLSVPEGRVVKGTRFRELQYAGEPAELAEKYYREGADEICFLDITASSEKRQTMLKVLRKACKRVFVPVTVGGGIRSVEDAVAVLQAGADKVSMNTATLERPELVSEISEILGSQACVIAVDALYSDGEYYCTKYGGREKTSVRVLDWVRKAEELGAGEILLTSMNRDGTKQGFDLELTRKVAEAVQIPVIASGGAGSLEDIYKAAVEGRASAVLAASIFHYGKFSLQETKDFLKSRDLEMRE